jgi:hypothetical protein
MMSSRSSREKWLLSQGKRTRSGGYVWLCFIHSLSHAVCPGRTAQWKERLSGTRILPATSITLWPVCLIYSVTVVHARKTDIFLYKCVKRIITYICFSCSILQQPCVLKVFPNFSDAKLKLKKVEQVALGHTANKQTVKILCWSWPQSLCASTYLPRCPRPGVIHLVQFVLLRAMLSPCPILSQSSGLFVRRGTDAFLTQFYKIKWKYLRNSFYVKIYCHLTGLLGDLELPGMRPATAASLAAQSTQEISLLVGTGQGTANSCLSDFPIDHFPTLARNAASLAAWAPPTKAEGWGWGQFCLLGKRPAVGPAEPATAQKHTFAYTQTHAHTCARAPWLCSLGPVGTASFAWTEAMILNWGQFCHPGKISGDMFTVRT